MSYCTRPSSLSQRRHFHANRIVISRARDFSKGNPTPPFLRGCDFFLIRTKGSYLTTSPPPRPPPWLLATALSSQRPSPFCHPERSRGICSPLHRPPISKGNLLPPS